MFFRRHSEADGVNVCGDQGVQVAQNGDAEFFADLAGARGVRVDDADELCALNFLPHAHMVAPELSGTHHRDANQFIGQDCSL